MSIFEMKPLEIFAEVEKIIPPTRINGKIVPSIYMVGGCVRDHLIGRDPYDYDFCTPLSPLAVEEKIRACGKRPYLIGNRFGTVGVKVQDKDKMSTLVEITTFRTEKYEDGSRKPMVEYVSSLEEDLSRRDFTINALAMKSDGEIIDYHNGKEDIAARLIRSVGKPKDRFKEDPLRMLRAARFASQLGFAIDADILKATKEMNHKILEVSKERWMMELDKMLVSDNPRAGLEFMFETRLMNFMLPEISLQYNYEQDNPHHEHPLHEHTICVVENTIQDPIIRWAALLHDVAKPFLRQKKENPPRSVYYKHELLGFEFAEKMARYLKWSNERTAMVSEMVFEHMNEDSIFKEADMKAK
jgi:tRNA nucleotidyltransferase/poly(A) polymerase